MEKKIKNTHYYEIEIQGQLSRRRIQAFDGLEITLTADGRTIIHGKELDQSALFGILLLIRDMGAPLLSVTNKDPLLVKQNQ